MPIVLFITFIVIPLVELSVILQVGQVIGTIPTIVLLVADSLIGAWLVKREGLRAWRSLTATFSGGGGSPVDELTQGALIVFGGALLLTPGFVTDALGLACVLPVTRPAMSSFVRRVISVVTARRMGAGRATSLGAFFGAGGFGPRDRSRGPGANGRVGTPRHSSQPEPGDGCDTRRRPVRPTSGPSGSFHTSQSEDQASGPVPDVEVVSIEREGE